MSVLGAETVILTVPDGSILGPSPDEIEIRAGDFETVDISGDATIGGNLTVSSINGSSLSGAIVTTTGTQTLTNKTIVDSTNDVAARKILVSAGGTVDFVTSAAPAAGYLIRATGASSAEFATVATAVPFNDISPLTTKGDLIAMNSLGQNTRVALGAATHGYTLFSNPSSGTGLTWAAACAVAYGRVNFETAATTITGSFGVLATSSIPAAGSRTVTFTNAMSSTDYVVVLGDEFTSRAGGMHYTISAKTVNDFTILSFDAVGHYVSFAVFGTYAYLPA